MQSFLSRQFARCILGCAIAIGVGSGMSAARAEDSRTLRGVLESAETGIAVEAGEHAPRLTTLTLRGATAWKNRAEEALPAHVEIHGLTQPVVWRLDTRHESVVGTAARRGAEGVCTL
jgi:hypothetical protein